MRIYKGVYAEINLDKLIHNLNIIKDLNKNKNIIAVLKDDAYGHGAVEISNKLIENGVKIIAVANVEEGVELRKSGVLIPILILGVTPLEYINELLVYRLTQAITSLEYAVLLSRELLRIGKRLNVHIKVETGMGRMGLFASDENSEIVNNIFMNPYFKIEGIYSHFSDADNLDQSYTLFQYKLFNKFCNNIDFLKLNIKYRHICNSAGSINFDFENSNCVRPGIALYGYNVSLKKKDLQFQPIMNLKAKIIHIKRVPKGSFIGYGKTYMTDRDSVIATINIGYGYGYPRYLSNKGKVIVKGFYANIVGNVCMDHFMIDITHIKNVDLFDEVVLIGEMGEKKLYADNIASFGETICYEVLCGINRGITRIYIENDEIINVRGHIL